MLHICVNCLATVLKHISYHKVTMHWLFPKHFIQKLIDQEDNCAAILELNKLLGD